MPRPYNVININGHIVPATLHDGLKKMRHQIQLGRVMNKSRRRYVTHRANGLGRCYCPLGAMLSPAQIDHILTQEGGRDFGNKGNWHCLATRKIGVPNAEAVMGMRLDDADTIQMDFDSGGLEALRTRLDAMLRNRNYPNPATAHTGAWHFPVSGQ